MLSGPGDFFFFSFLIDFFTSGIVMSFCMMSCAAVFVLSHHLLISKRTKLWNLKIALNDEESKGQKITLEDEGRTITGKAASKAFVKGYCYLDLETFSSSAF
jgi:hypothetical protein